MKKRIRALMAIMLAAFFVVQNTGFVVSAEGMNNYVPYFCYNGVNCDSGFLYYPYIDSYTEVTNPIANPGEYIIKLGTANSIIIVDSNGEITKNALLEGNQEYYFTELPNKEGYSSIGWRLVNDNKYFLAVNFDEINATYDEIDYYSYISEYSLTYNSWENYHMEKSSSSMILTNDNLSSSDFPNIFIGEYESEISMYDAEGNEYLVKVASNGSSYSLTFSIENNLKYNSTVTSASTIYDSENVPSETCFYMKRFVATAEYSPINYNIEYDLGGGKVSEGELTDSYTIEDSIQLPILLKDGYEFEGYNIYNSNGDIICNTLTTEITQGTIGDLTCKAVWKQNNQASLSLDDLVFSENYNDNIIVDFTDRTDQPIITSEAIYSLASKKAILNIKQGKFNFVINGKNINPENSIPGNIDFKISGLSEEDNSAIINQAKSIFGIEPMDAFEIAHDGDYGFNVGLQINVGVENANKYANLCYYNRSTNKVQLIGSCKVGADGNTAYDNTHASQYMIVITDRDLGALEGQYIDASSVNNITNSPTNNTVTNSTTKNAATTKNSPTTADNSPITMVTILAGMVLVVSVSLKKKKKI